MAIKRSLVEIVHDDGYGDSLLSHINHAFGSKNMRAERIADQQEAIDLLEKVRSRIRGLSNRGLRNFTNYGEDEMRSRCSEVVSDMIKSLEKSKEESHENRN